MRNKRLITWPAAGFLLGFGAPISDPTVQSTSDVLLASSLIATLPAFIGFVAALIRIRRPSNELRSLWLLIGLAAATVLLKLLQPNGFALVPAAIFVRAVWTKDSTEPA